MVALPLLHPRTPNRGWSTVALFPVPPDSYAPPRCHAPPGGGQGLALPNQTPLSQEGLFSGALARGVFQPLVPVLPPVGIDVPQEGAGFAEDFGVYAWVVFLDLKEGHKQGPE